ncbi:hypothetical protein ACFQ9Y_16515 [Peribacillus simplex]|uniref:hypothetical protein n=1 Tax=Peribacillus simplex TaxID=1478 RepID=UPI00367301EB
MFFPVILIGLKTFATLQPNNCLAQNPQIIAVRRLGSLTTERGRISQNKLELF